MDINDWSPVLGRLLGPGQSEVTCEVCFTDLDRYVELELGGADPEAAVPGMRAPSGRMPRLLQGTPEPDRLPPSAATAARSTNRKTHPLKVVPTT